MLGDDKDMERRKLNRLRAIRLAGWDRGNRLGNYKRDGQGRPH